MIDVNKLTITKAHKHLSSGDFSVSELVEACVKNIEKKDSQVHAYLEVFEDWKAQAKEAQNLFDEKKAALLSGIPIAFKDNIMIKGRAVSAASNILEGHRAIYDATVTSKLKKEKAVFLGRTNMDEFAMGSSTENSAFGATKNPHDLTRVPGGTSGGSAAAVAMGGTLAALGSDTNGSVRQPASFCGCVGFKPTYGSVSRHGLIAMGNSLDQIGPITKTVGDTEILFDAMKGLDPLDSTTVEVEDHSLPSKIKVGVPRSLVEQEGVEPEVRENFEESLKKLKDSGFEIVDISLPHTHLSLAAYYIILPAEVSTNLSRYDGVKYGLHKEGEDLLGDYLNTRSQGFGKEARRRIILGTYVLSAGYYDAYYEKAKAVRKLVISDFEKVFKDGPKVDVIVTPTTPTPAFKLGEKVSDPLAMYMSDIFTCPASITGLPAITLPSGFSKDKLPLGLQVIGPYHKEKSIFKVGKEFLGEMD